MERDLMDIVREQAENDPAEWERRRAEILSEPRPPRGMCGHEECACPPPWEDEEPADWHDAPNKED